MVCFKCTEVLVMLETVHSHRHMLRLCGGAAAMV